MLSFPAHRGLVASQKERIDPIGQFSKDAHVMMDGRIGSTAVVLFAMVSALFAQVDTPRPRILGIAHVGIRSNDLDHSRAFYENLLGFGEPFSLKRDDGTEWIVFIKVNDTQYIELFAEARMSGNALGHFALYTDNVDHMKAYLESAGVHSLDNVHTGRTGNRFFSISDPDGHILEIVQYEPGSWTEKTSGEFLPTDRVSGHIMHVGLRVSSMSVTERFYHDLLGFQEFRDTSFPARKGWVILRVADGDDYLELIPYTAARWAESQKLQDHFCLTVPNARHAVRYLQQRGKNEARSVARDIDVEVGDHRAWQVNLLDPSGIRVELREPESAQKKDGAPTTPPGHNGASTNNH
jgi:lactoylglutathione lyase